MSRQHRFQAVKNTLATMALMGAVIVLPTAVAYLFWGSSGLFIAAAMMAVSLFFERRIPTAYLLRRLGAVKLESWQSPRLFDHVHDLSKKAGLDNPPNLYLLRDSRFNAFTLGTGSEASVVVSRGLLEALPPREVVAVIAHEVAHVASGDLSLLDTCERLRRVTSKLSIMGVVLLLLVLFSGTLIGPAPWLLLMAAPLGANLLILALSRTREFAADLTACGLMGEPVSLANALVRMETSQLSLFERLFNVRFNAMVPEALRTHPPTEERVHRLRGLVASPRKEARVMHL